jgi:hypothetical protein
VGITAGLFRSVKAMLSKLIGEKGIAFDYEFLNNADFA